MNTGQSSSLNSEKITDNLVSVSNIIYLFKALALSQLFFWYFGSENG